LDTCKEETIREILAQTEGYKQRISKKKESGFNSTASGYIHMADFCQHSEIFSGLIQDCNVLDQLSDCTLLKKETALLRQSPNIYALLSAQLIIKLALWSLLLINCQLIFVL
jgi:hypothetical protein